MTFNKFPSKMRISSDEMYSIAVGNNWDYVAFGQLKIIIKTVFRLFTCTVRLGALILNPGTYFSHIKITYVHIFL